MTIIFSLQSDANIDNVGFFFLTSIFGLIAVLPILYVYFIFNEMFNQIIIILLILVPTYILTILGVLFAKIIQSSYMNVTADIKQERKHGGQEYIIIIQYITSKKNQKIMNEGIFMDKTIYATLQFTIIVVNLICKYCKSLYLLILYSIKNISMVYLLILYIYVIFRGK